MRRREFITLIGGAATWPLAARAQQPALPVIGYLSSESPETQQEYLTAFHRGLADTGYVEGRNVAIEYRWAEGQNDRLPMLAADLVRRQVAAIATAGLASTLAGKRATTTIPVVFQVGADPVELGLVASLNRPAGNMTGVTSLNEEVAPKRLELLHELIPSVAVIALLINPTNPNAETLSTNLQAAARALGLQLPVLYAGTERDFDAVVARLVQLHAGGLVIGADSFLTSQSGHLAALALRHAVPAIFSGLAFARAGGLMSYGGSLREWYGEMGVYTGRILKGEKPADLPVQQSTKVELIINMKTAKALGLTVPITLLGRADEVIE
jgi:putative ABC transport system substrate-binding protein